MNLNRGHDTVTYGFEKFSDQILFHHRKRVLKKYLVQINRRTLVMCLKLDRRQMMVFRQTFF